MIVSFECGNKTQNDVFSYFRKQGERRFQVSFVAVIWSLHARTTEGIVCRDRTAVK